MIYRIAITVRTPAELDIAIKALDDSDLGGGALDTIKIEVVR